MSFNPMEHLMDLKGKKYLQVMWRLVWFREEKPLWCIDTQLVNLTENHAVFAAKIYDENGVLKAAGYGSEGIKDFRDFIEKAETKAIGRALAMLGYGTQFAPELDEGERIVDSPAPIKQKIACEDCGCLLAPAEVNGKVYSIQEQQNATMNKYGRVLCMNCRMAMSKTKEADHE